MTDDSVEIVTGNAFLRAFELAEPGTWTLVNDKRDGTFKLTIGENTIQALQEDVRPLFLQQLDTLRYEKVPHTLILRG